jgi:hypothetical protein
MEGLDAGLRHGNEHARADRALRRRVCLKGSRKMIKKVRSHIVQNEPLLFERSSPGKKAYQLPELDVPDVDYAAELGADNVREEIPGFPEVSEVEVIRHFTRLSTWNYAIDLGLYPLGSCTMKYNPRLNEHVARLEGWPGRIPISRRRSLRACCACSGTWRNSCARSAAWTR